MRIKSALAVLRVPPPPPPPLSYVALENGHVCVRSHLLVLGGQVAAVLVLVVAQTARYSKVATHTPKVNEAAGSLE